MRRGSAGCAGGRACAIAVFSFRVRWPTSAGMPELPEVETVCRGLRPALEGRRLERVVLRRPDLRIPFPVDFAQRLQGRRIDRLERRGKYILATCDNGTVLIAHLGMSGRLSVHEPQEVRELGRFVHNQPPPALELGPHDHVVFDVEGGTRIVYTDHRRFGLMTLAEPGTVDAHPLLRHLGLEPFLEAFHARSLGNLLKSKRTSIKAALLDQEVVAGLGNIYVCEALFRAGLLPTRLAGSLRKPHLEALVAAIRSVLEEAIAAGGSTLRDYAHADGSLGYFQHAFAVYGRAGDACSRRGCDGKVRRLVQSNRSTFYCPSCQH